MNNRLFPSGIDGRIRHRVAVGAMLLLLAGVVIGLGGSMPTSWRPNLATAVATAVTTTTTTANERLAVPTRLAPPRALLFEPNRGQAPRAVRYLARTPAAALAIFDDGMALSPAAPGRAGAQLRFVNSRSGGAFTEREPASSQTHHLIGSDPAQWQRGLPQFRQLRYAGLYPGIDLVYYSRDGDFEFDLVVHPGADPAQIRLQASAGTSGVKPVVDAAGDLLLDGEAGLLRVKRPVLYQHIDGRRSTLDARWRLADDGQLTIDLPAYDKAHTLVIDPVFKLLHSTYVGGVHNDLVGDMVLDAQGNAYIAGHSGSEDWPVSGNAFQSARKNLGSYVYNVIVTKFDAGGALIWSTFIGGSTNDYARAIKLDAKGQVVIAGQTLSADFPTTADAMQRQRLGAANAFIAVLSPDGSTLVHSTFYGGAGGSSADAIVLDGSGRLWLAGTAGSGLPTTAGSYKPAFIGSGNAGYIARFSAPAAGPLRLETASYYGIDNPPADVTFVGSGAFSLALAPSGAVWFTGQARHELLPTTANALMPAPTAIDHNARIGVLPLCAFAYIARLSADLATLEYASYLTGYTREARDRSSCSEYGRSVVVDAAGDLIVNGSTSSDRFPTTAAALQTAYPGAGSNIGHVGFVTKVKGDGSGIVWSTYLGGNGGDTFLVRMVGDAASNAVWVGALTSGGANFPLSADALQRLHGGGTYDASYHQLDAASGALKYGTLMGGSGNDTGELVVTDASGNAYLAGPTESRNLVVTPTAFQGVYTPNAFDGSDWFFRIIGSGTIGSVRPSRGGNAGDVTLSMATTGVADGAVATLVGPDGTAFNARGLVVGASGATRITFTLDGAAVGRYALRVSNLDGRVFTRPDAFEVVSGGVPELSVQVIGRPKIRVGVPASFQVQVTNSGSTDAYFVPLWVVAPEAVSIGVRNFSVERSDALTTVAGGRRYYNQLLPRVLAGETVTVPVSVMATTNLESLPIRASLQRPWFRTVTEARAQFPDGGPGKYDPNCFSDVAHAEFANCAGLYLQYAHAGARALALEPGETAPTGSGSSGRERALGNPICDALPGGSFDKGKADGATDAKNGNSNAYNPPNIKSDPIGAALYNMGYTAGVLGAVAGAAGGSSSSAAGRPDARRLALTASTTGGAGQPTARPLADPACDVPPLPNPPPTFPRPSTNNSSSAGSIDPNDKYGPPGDGSAAHFIRQAAPMPFTIAFENLASAGLPAAEVVVTDQLDVAKFDLATLTLGDISWGPHRISVPPGLNSYATVYTIDTTLSVRVQGSLNPTTGVLKWTFTSIDPATKLPPSDPTLGFLPPNRNGTEGQGYVSFTIGPKAGAADGAKWENLASIVFDTNAPIVTPTWVNTLDLSTPASRVNSAAQKSGAVDIDVAWSGSDNGSGVAGYTIYVSDNGGAFSAWQSDVTATSASYPGVIGHSYGFFVLARDKAGNAEVAKAAAEMTVEVRDPAASGGGGGGGGAFALAVLGERATTLVLLLLALVILFGRRAAGAILGARRAATGAAPHAAPHAHSHAHSHALAARRSRR